MYKKLLSGLLFIAILPVAGSVREDKIKPVEQSNIVFQQQTTDIDRYFYLSELGGASINSIKGSWGTADIYAENEGFEVFVYLDKRTELWFDPETELLYAAFVYMPRYVPYDGDSELLQSKILYSIGVEWTPPTEKTGWSVNWDYSGSSFEQIRIHKIPRESSYSNVVICIFLREPIEREF